MSDLFDQLGLAEEPPRPVVRDARDFEVREVLDRPVLVGRVPDEVLEAIPFDVAWDLHPPEYPTVQMAGKPTRLPRWQQPYDKDYVFSGQRNEAVPLPEALRPFSDWAQGVYAKFNGVLLNWYDADLGNYIGAHRDSTVGLVHMSPILTASLGATRVFRLRRFKQPGPFVDIEVRHGDAVLLPWVTNQALAHEVPHLARHPGRRISLTARAFA